MRVTTPAIRLDLHPDTLGVQADRMKLTGVAGILPCEARLTAPEAAALLELAQRPAVPWWVLRGRDVARA